MADAMIAAARQQPGFQRVVSARTPDDVGITVSYWDSLVAIKAWGEQHAHKVAREKAIPVVSRLGFVHGTSLRSEKSAD